MSIFGSRSSPTAASQAPTDINSRKQAVMNSVREEVALQNAHELMNKANEKCFLKCVTKPGASLSGAEETCLSRCLDRYMEAFDVVSKAYVARLRAERQAAQPSLS